MVSQIAQPQISTNWQNRDTLSKCILPGHGVSPIPSQFYAWALYREKEITWGEHFQNNGFSSTRVGKIFHMRVPGDIIAGTDGQDVPECWSAKYNMAG